MGFSPFVSLLYHRGGDLSSVFLKSIVAVDFGGFVIHYIKDVHFIKVEAIGKQDFIDLGFIFALNKEVAAIFEVFAQVIQHINHFLSFGGSLPLCEYIVAYLRDFVKRFLKKSFEYFLSQNA